MPLEITQIHKYEFHKPVITQWRTHELVHRKQRYRRRLNLEEESEVVCHVLFCCT
jgi:hypothetical protein